MNIHRLKNGMFYNAKITCGSLKFYKTHDVIVQNRAEINY